MFREASNHQVLHVSPSGQVTLLPLLVGQNGHPLPHPPLPLATTHYQRIHLHPAAVGGGCPPPALIPSQGLQPAPPPPFHVPSLPPFVHPVSSQPAYGAVQPHPPQAIPPYSLHPHPQTSLVPDVFFNQPPQGTHPQIRIPQLTQPPGPGLHYSLRFPPTSARHSPTQSHLSFTGASTCFPLSSSRASTPAQRVSPPLSMGKGRRQETTTKLSEETSSEQQKSNGISESWVLPLSTLMKHSRMNMQKVWKVSSSKESFGVAWVCLALLKRGKVRVPSLKLDVSDCRLSPGKVFLLLTLLPSSAEELKLGASAVKDRGFPLLHSFLSRLWRGSTRLKSLAFGENSIEANTSFWIFSSLPPSVESVSLKGNHHTSWLKGLQSAVGTGAVRFCLKSLVLDDTQLTSWDVTELFQTFGRARSLLEPSIRVETLSLSDTGGVRPL